MKWWLINLLSDFVQIIFRTYFVVLKILFKRGLLKYKKNTPLEAPKGLEEEGVEFQDPIFVF